MIWLGVSFCSSSISLSFKSIKLKPVFQRADLCLNKALGVSDMKKFMQDWLVFAVFVFCLLAFLKMLAVALG
jgi:hypothetical protein